ncbi:uncharacterized protein LOC143234969 [Tachypleus tridentatus]|uniref:uncharacterized protein LOC143234969 n=1 Tax=Tachypleus tridentatus TaxID=6853 RepID=UPI003FD68DA3
MARMNSAAVIGRQIRQQHGTGKQPPPTPTRKPRPRTPSHQHLHPLPTLGYGSPLQNEEEQKPKSRFSWACCWRGIKSLSAGITLILVGTVMSVVGFYADPLATYLEQRGNETMAVLNEVKKFHLHNLTYAGPVIMGIGGIVIVAACVLTFDGKDAGARVVPMKEQHADGEVAVSEHLEGQLHQKDFSSGTGHYGNYLTVPNMSPFFPIRKPSIISLNERRGSKIETKGETVSNARILNGLPKPQRSALTLPTRRPSSQDRSLSHLMSPQIEDDFVASPQDIVLSDPDGCDTPCRCSVGSMELELYVPDCAIMISVNAESPHLATIESDGLSDSETSEGREPRLGCLDDDDGQAEPLLKSRVMQMPKDETSFSNHQLKSETSRPRDFEDDLEQPLLHDSLSNRSALALKSYTEPLDCHIPLLGRCSPQTPEMGLYMMKLECPSERLSYQTGVNERCNGISG